MSLRDVFYSSDKRVGRGILTIIEDEGEVSTTVEDWESAQTIDEVASGANTSEELVQSDLAIGNVAKSAPGMEGIAGAEASMVAVGGSQSVYELLITTDPAAGIFHQSPFFGDSLDELTGVGTSGLGTVDDVTSSSTAVDSILSNDLATDTFLMADPAVDSFVNSPVAMNVLVGSDQGLEAFSESERGMSGVAGSQVAMDEVSGSELAVDIFSGSATAVQELYSTPTTRRRYFNTPFAGSIWSASEAVDQYLSSSSRSGFETSGWSRSTDAPSGAEFSLRAGGSDEWSGGTDFLSLDIDLTDIEELTLSTKHDDDFQTDLVIEIGVIEVFRSDSGHSWTDRQFDVSGQSGTQTLTVGGDHDGDFTRDDVVYFSLVSLTE